MTITRFPLALASLLVLSMSIQLDAAEQLVSFSEPVKGKLAIRVDDQTIANFSWDDPQIPRPYFDSLSTLGGVQVSRNHPPHPEQDVADHPTYHPGLWMAFGDISGSDYWRNKAQVKYVADSLTTSGGENSGRLQANFQYLDQADSKNVICNELLTCQINCIPQGYLIMWDSVFSSDQPFYFGDQEEMGIGVRVATAMRSERRERGAIPPGNGKIIDAEGRINGAEVWGKSAKWCDYQGTLEGKQVGVTLLCHPENFRPSWFHARDYGLLVANAFGQKAFRQGETSHVDVKPGKSFRIRYGVFIYAVKGETRPDLNDVYSTYVKLSAATAE